VLTTEGPDVTDVGLRLVDETNVREACRISLKAGQEKFVAPVAVSLAQAYVSADVAWPRLIYDGETLVGFVMAEFDEKEVSYFLWRLNIADEHQGRGYGRFAVFEVAREAMRRGATQLLTSYVPGDDGPAGFYGHLGFEPTGEIDDDEIVVALDLATIVERM
jgi:diamine N-acetyltransferase